MFLMHKLSIPCCHARRRITARIETSTGRYTKTISIDGKKECHKSNRFLIILEKALPQIKRDVRSNVVG